MITTIHVDRDRIVSNRDKYNKPVFIVEKDGVILLEADKIEILGPSKLVYQPDNPHPVLSERYDNNRSVRAWIETESEVIKIK